ncbi:50S ribosomal protein L3 N(5)-glutamine methyltransferase [Litoribacillus peritrichatus]|uniref:Ribosomal protein uL3 glutamine methyltransferase n=1 Tax=Litoribacillus peritrichatus TaxID=718191 RepID=A0ABP7MH28_9GAMM
MNQLEDLDHDPAVSELKTVQDMARWCFSSMNQSDVYFGHGTDNAWDESVQLVLFTLALPWHSYDDFKQAGLLASERSRIVQNLHLRLVERVPLPYIFNVAWYCDLPFYVDERVLIPRSPIAELIKSRFDRWLENEPSKILDMCTGSGCIGIATAYQFRDAEVDLVDLSMDALEVAQQNIDDHNLSDRVFPIQSDLFSSIPDGVKYDLILANPPYVDQEDFDLMPNEFEHEPEMALLSGFDGMDAPKQILLNAARYLSDDGVFVMEVGYSMQNLEAAFPGVKFKWLKFENGGDGVFVMTRKELIENQQLIAEACKEA